MSQRSTKSTQGKGEKVKKTETEALEKTKFAMIETSTADIAKIVEENLGEKISITDLPRIKVPTGGGTSWELPSLGNDSEASKTFTGIIVYSRPARSLFLSNELDNSPPDCYSDDGIVGHGNPGGDCASCFYNKFGSKGKNPETTLVTQLGVSRGAKGCANKRALFILRENELLPTVLVLPVMSVKK